MKLQAALAALAAGVLVAAACQATQTITPSPGMTASPKQSAEPGQTSSGQPTATTAEPPSTAGVSPPEGSFEVGSGSFYLADTRAGLANLSSYTQTLTVTFDGTHNGQAAHWSEVRVLKHTTEPLASVLTIEATGDVEPPDPSLLADASGASYEIPADGVCTGVVADPDHSSVSGSEPAGLLPSLIGADDAGTGDKNGVAANHYTFDERAMADAGAAQTAGEVWVATDGGYVLAFQLSTTAAADYFGEGIEGSETWDYQLTDVNQAIDVALPAGCQIDAPPMPDATNLLALPSFMGFDTPSSVADATSYYLDQLPARGWTQSDEPVATEEGTVSIQFTKDSATISVLVTTRDTGTRVDVLLIPQ